MFKENIVFRPVAPVEKTHARQTCEIRYKLPKMTFTIRLIPTIVITYKIKTKPMKKPSPPPVIIYKVKGLGAWERFLKKKGKSK